MCNVHIVHIIIFRCRVRCNLTLIVWYRNKQHIKNSEWMLRYTNLTIVLNSVDRASLWNVIIMLEAGKSSRHFFFRHLKIKDKKKKLYIEVTLLFFLYTCIYGYILYIFYSKFFDLFLMSFQIKENQNERK